MVPDRVALFGGLGNQLFQWSFGQYLAALGRRVEYERPPGDSFPIAEVLPELAGTETWTRGFGPNSGVQRAKDRVRRLCRAQTEAVVDLSVFGSPRARETPSRWFGYWQDPSFASETVVARVRSALERHAPVRVSERFTVVAHVRRGDYVGLAPLLSPDYYIAGISAALVAAPAGISTDVAVVTNDPPWVERKLGRRIPLRVAGGSAVEDLALLTSADAVILSASTFSWWGGRTNLRQRVFAPRPWYIGTDRSDLYAAAVPKDWRAITASYHGA